MSNDRPLCPKCAKPVYKKGNNKGRQRFFCSPCSWHGTAPLYLERHENRGLERVDNHANIYAKKYIITSAQNATGVHRGFYDNLRRYAAHRGAQLLVIPYRYKNPTSHWSKRAEGDDWWASDLDQFLFTRRVHLHPLLVVLGDIKTQPTAAEPLTGFEGISGGASAIIGHPKYEQISVPTPQNKLPKLLTTTGSITLPNYTPTKAGKKGAFHHTFGAIIVELQDDKFHMRHINATSNGDFQDLGYRVSGGLVREGQPVEALVMGDTHVEVTDPEVTEATFGKAGIVQTLRPKTLVWHDLHDFYAGNHHHKGEVFVKYAKHIFKKGNVFEDLKKTFAYVDTHSPSWCKNVIVFSNHPAALARWVKETDPRTDPENCVFWAETFKAMAEGTTWAPTGARTIDPFAYWGRRLLRHKNTHFLKRNENYTIRGIEVGFHGDDGPNGSRGTLNSFGKIGVRSIFGHGHGPGFRDGAMQVGTSSYLRLEFINGPSSHLNTHAIIYPNGKRALINIIGGEWRG